jgi:23S rRNA (cytidine1920-2'-O)/16S rRNA (cytidine1409-2'-O)-methyltransferase
VRRRLDSELVRRGLSASRERARADIEAGRVTVAGAPTTKPARLVAPDEAIVVRTEGPRYASRGGTKLAAALDAFEIDVAGARALDAGASTGGFTDCLLQRGAHHVTALDVGYGQLDQRLRDDPRVRCLERTNVRHVEADELGDPFDVVVADLSFISLTTVLPALLAVSRPAAPLVLLVKPQFEAGRQEASKGRGVIRDPAVWTRAVDDVGTALHAGGAAIMGCMVSPLLGAEGNVEFLLAARAPVADASAAAAGVPLDLAQLTADALALQGR